jgi:hypothetical protein
MQNEILDVLSGEPDRWTAAAVSWSLGRAALGPLAQEPEPEIADALATLVGAGTVVEISACPVCERPGPLYLLAERADAGAPDAPSISAGELEESMEPLISEGLIEVSEIVELEARDCCARTMRAWRRAPRPT